MAQGYVKLDRGLLEKHVFKNEKLLKVWIWCLLKATHKPHEETVGLQKVQLQPGQFVTGRFAAAEELRMNPNTFWKNIKYLSINSSIVLKSNNKFTLVTIVNWEFYQDEKYKKEHQNNNKITTKEQQNNTNNNGNNDKNDDLGTNPPTPQGATNDDQCPPLIVKPVKVKFAEFVAMTNDEHLSLVARLGSEERFGRCVEILDNYKGANGKKYRSDYRAMLNWVITRLEEEEKKTHRNGGQPIPRAFSSLEEWAAGKENP